MPRKAQPRPKTVRQRNARTVDGLNPKQQRFRDALLEGVTVPQAAERAGYTPQHAHRLMQDPLMQDALKAGHKRLSEAGICDKLDIMREGWRLASSDIRQLLGRDCTLLDPSEWPDDAARAVQSIEVLEVYEGTGKDRKFVGNLKKLKLHPKIAALDLVAKMLGAFAAPKEPVGPDGKPIPSRRVALFLPRKKTEAEMAGYGSQAAAVAAREAKPPPPLADDAAAPAHKAVMGRLSKMKLPPA
jgi:phage terminase small subunit